MQLISPDSEQESAQRIFRYSACRSREVLEGMLTFSDKIGHKNCVILRDSRKASIFRERS